MLATAEYMNNASYHNDNKSNSTACAVQVEAILQEQLCIIWSVDN